MEIKITPYSRIDESALEGFSVQRKRFRESQVAAAVTLIGDVLSGRIPSYYIKEAIMPRTPAVIRSIMTNYPDIIRVAEAMTTSDFASLTGDVIDRIMLARFRSAPSPWRRIARVRTNLPDFRAVNLYDVDGLEGQWESIPEQDEVKYGSLSETTRSYKPKKYGKAAKMSFEAIMNDDLDMFDSIPRRLGLGGARTISKFFTQLYVDANGPHASIYTVGNGNIVTGNPVLSVSALQTAWTILGNMKDSEGEPVVFESVILVVPQALSVTAQNITNATMVNLTTVGGASGQEMAVNNWFGSQFSVEVDPYIKNVASSANGDTSWFLFGNPASEPAIEMGFVRGFEEPQLYQKASNTARVGGGIDQMAGDFLTMSQEYKGVVAFGGAVISPKFTVGSKGNNS